jgi:hypothetical protein
MTLLKNEPIDAKPVASVASRLESLPLMLPGGPFPIEIEYREKDVIVRDRDPSGWYGEGKTVERAISNLQSRMRLALKDLIEHESVLDKDLVADLRKLRFYLGE